MNRDEALKAECIKITTATASPDELRAKTKRKTKSISISKKLAGEALVRHEEEGYPTRPTCQLVTLEGILWYRKVGDEIRGVTFKHLIAEIHAISMKRLSKAEAADDPSDGADDE